MMSHESVLFPCGGGFCNTGLAVYQACYEVVQELGLARVGIGCVSALPLGNKSVIKKSLAARHIITVDGCPNQCARRLVEEAQLPLTRSLEMVRDARARKVRLHRDLETGAKPVDDYILRADVDAMRRLILVAIEEG